MSNNLTISSTVFLINIQVNYYFWNFLNFSFDRYLSNYFIFLFQTFSCKFAYGKFIEFSILLSNHNFSNTLNAKHKNILFSTDGLSFSFSNNMISKESNYLFLGEIVISFDDILTKSFFYKETFMYSCLRVILHSFLHLLDYNHVTYYCSFLIKLLELKFLSKSNLINK